MSPNSYKTEMDNVFFKCHSGNKMSAKLRPLKENRGNASRINFKLQNQKKGKTQLIQ